MLCIMWLLPQWKDKRIKYYYDTIEELSGKELESILSLTYIRKAPVLFPLLMSNRRRGPISFMIFLINMLFERLDKATPRAGHAIVVVLSLTQQNA